jgi:hypothetical protein
MPMQRDLYPSDWDEIARSIKEAAGWQCQECGRPCRRPGESIDNLVIRLQIDHYNDWADELADWVEDDEFGYHEAPVRVGRFVLTVAHLNHQPADCHPENLRALCAPCHLRYDASQMALKRRLKQEREGQLTLSLPQSH